MSRVLVCDHFIFNSFIKSTEKSPLTYGVVVGQYTNVGTDYALYCPTFSPKREVHKVADIGEGPLIKFARLVNGALPGGMFVMGYFFVTSELIFKNDELVNKVIKLLRKAESVLSEDPYEFAVKDGSTPIVIHYNATDRVTICNEFFLDKDLVKMFKVDMIYSSTVREFHMITYLWNHIAPYKITELDGVVSQPEELYEQLDHFHKKLCTSDYAVNKIREEPEKHIKDCIVRKKIERTKEHEQQEKEAGLKLDHEDVLHVNIYMDDDPEEIEALEVAKSPGGAFSELSLYGISTSRVMVHPDACVRDVIQAVKMDLVRSWRTRLQKHVNSYDDGAEPEFLLHPRRAILVVCKVNLSFSVYLFPNEALSDSRLKLQLMKDYGLLMDDKVFTFDPYKPMEDNSPHKIMDSINKLQNRPTQECVAPPKWAVVLAGSIIVAIGAVITYFFPPPSIDLKLDPTAIQSSSALQ